MLNKEKNILKGISKQLAEAPGLLKIIAYGSRVRGDYTGDSDLDVLVIVDEKDRRLKSKIVDAFYSYELETDISFSLTIFSLEEFEFNKGLGSPFIKDIENEGIVFYDSERRRKESTFQIPT